MDIFNEYIVKKAKDGKDYAMIAMFLLVGMIGGTLLASIFAAIQFLASFSLLVLAGSIYFMYWGITSRNIEYEYIVTNGELDVDSIVHRRKRKRLMSVSSKTFDLFAPMNSEHSREIERQQDLKKIDASSGRDVPNRYFALFSKDSVRYLLIFEPTDKMLADFERFVPRSKFFRA